MNYQGYFRVQKAIKVAAQLKVLNAEMAVLRAEMETLLEEKLVEDFDPTDIHNLMGYLGDLNVFAMSTDPRRIKALAEIEKLKARLVAPVPKVIPVAKKAPVKPAVKAK